MTASCIARSTPWISQADGFDTWRCPVRILLAAFAVIAVAACGDDTDSTDVSSTTIVVETTTMATTTTEGVALPPSEDSAKQRPRRALCDTAPAFTVAGRRHSSTSGTYQTSPEGTHLADSIWWRRRNAPPTRLPRRRFRWRRRFFRMILTVAWAHVIRRLPGTVRLGKGDPNVPSDTIVNVSREDAEFVDWDTVTLAEAVRHRPKP